MNIMTSYKATHFQKGVTNGSHWDDQNIDKNSVKPLILNIRAGADTRSRSTFQQSQEDISKTSLPASSKIKKTVNGSSDPRFKRVITAGAQNDACVGTEMKLSKPSSTAGTNEKPIPKAQESRNLVDQKPGRDSNTSNKVSMQNEQCEKAVGFSNAPAQKPVTRDSAQEHLKEVDKLSFNHDIVSSAVPKQSVSDSTINTRNTSLVSEDFGGDYADRLHTFSSTTRVKKVQNWIAEQKPKLDKRQSVITVIGQTQGQGALSSAFHEIDQRRKLVKELDKYAICNKIIDSDKDKEMNTLVAQINFLSPTGKLLLSGDKSYDKKDLKNKLKSAIPKNQEGGDKIQRHLETNHNDIVQCDKEANTEQETSLSHSSESFVIRNQKKKCYKWADKYDIKGKIRRSVSRVPYPFLAYFMIFVSGALCWYTYFAFQKNGYIIFELFPQKPKTTTWYEKACYWVWELFRPAANYHRSSSWSPH